MTSQVLNKLLVIGAAAAALSVAACSKPATNEADTGTANATAASTSNDVTNTSTNSMGATNTATNTGG
jgi:hypothetical protein